MLMFVFLDYNEDHSFWSLHFSSSFFFSFFFFFLFLHPARPDRNRKESKLEVREAFHQEAGYFSCINQRQRNTARLVSTATRFVAYAHLHTRCKGKENTHKRQTNNLK